VELILTEDQELLAKTAADFVSQHSPVSRVRKLRDTKDPVGFSRELWKQMAELGWLGIPFPESVGGAELGFAELAVVLEALGRTLAPEPFLSTVLLGGQALRLGGTEAQQKEWLSPLVNGDCLLTAAYQERQSRYDLRRVATRAEKRGDGWHLSGEKIQVLDGHVADALVVVARTAGGERDARGITLFLVRKGTPGLEITRQSRVDSRNAALVKLSGVAVGLSDVIGAVDEGGDLFEKVVDRAMVGLCAEMLGSMEEAAATTFKYLKTRVQFGVPIGSFQALKHRAARVYIELELSRSTVMAAARAVDEGHPELPKLASLVKARCSDAGILIANEAVQMHGGVGMTDEYDVGFYLKRARVAEIMFGDAPHHRERWAQLSGY
jgi:alkylation response protein AidB-like acyl-CoA dehydrogenase